MGAAVVRAVRSGTGHRPVDLALLTLWPIGIAIATVFDQQEHPWTGMVHNVAVGTAIVGVHLAAVRTRNRLLLPVAVTGFGGMVALLAMIVVHSSVGADLPLGVVERVLLAVNALLAIGALRGRRPTGRRPLRAAGRPHGG